LGYGRKQYNKDLFTNRIMVLLAPGRVEPYIGAFSGSAEISLDRSAAPNAQNGKAVA
jgi:hypothetical protein